jgi:hypothetical protein
LGRALPVWLAPALLASGAEAVDLSEAIYSHRLVYHRVAGIALVWSGVVALLLA